jgi:hypothetical protein
MIRIGIFLSIVFSSAVAHAATSTDLFLIANTGTSITTPTRVATFDTYELCIATAKSSFALQRQPVHSGEGAAPGITLVCIFNGK